MLIVRSNIKEVVKDCGVDNVSSDFADRLEAIIRDEINKACRRAIENNRRTVMAKDL